MGLPGSGKTYLTKRLQPLLQAAWYNADKVREMANDWDFSTEGRMRQSNRMRCFADFESFSAISSEICSNENGLSSCPSPPDESFTSLT